MMLGVWCNAQDSLITDQRDGHVYKTAEIGSLIWFVENLQYAMSGAQYYKNDSSTYYQHGRLYNKSHLPKACPNGWRVPTPKDWMILDSCIGHQGIYSLLDTLSWTYDSLITNSSGFSLNAGGYKINRRKFDYLGISSSLWFNDSSDTKSNYHLHIHHTNEKDGSSHFHSHNGVKNRKFYIRCVCENQNK